MNKERVGIIGSLTLAASVALSACGGEAPKPTQKPTQTENPTPTLVEVSPTPFSTPTPEATSTPVVATPTPEVTQAPTPEPTPMPISALIEGKHPKVSAKTITEDLDKALANPAFKDYQSWTASGAKLFWKYCQKGDPTAEGDPRIARLTDCEIFVVKSFEAGRKLNDPNFYKMAKDAYGYTYNTFTSAADRADLNDTLTQTFK